MEFELTNLQKELLKKYVKGTFEAFTATEEEQNAFSEMIDAAEKQGLDEDADWGDDLMLWWIKRNKIKL